MMPLVAVATKPIPAAPFIGQRVLVDGKTPAEVRVVCHQTGMAAVLTAAGELVALPWVTLYEEA